MAFRFLPPGSLKPLRGSMAVCTSGSWWLVFFIRLVCWPALFALHSCYRHMLQIIFSVIATSSILAVQSDSALCPQISDPMVTQPSAFFTLFTVFKPIEPKLIFLSKYVVFYLVITCWTSPLCSEFLTAHKLCTASDPFWNTLIAITSSIIASVFLLTQWISFLCEIPVFFLR